LFKTNSSRYGGFVNQSHEFKTERKSDMNTTQSAYFSAYRSVKMTRDAEGVLIVELHTKGGPLTFTAQDHTDFVDAFYQIAQDRANKIVILTGTAGEFIPSIDFSSFGNVADPEIWSQVHDEGVQILENLANIRVPVIAAIEGRANVHSEYALMANVIVAGQGATFNDLPHFAGGIVPGDGIFTTWSYRAGAGRAEAFLLNPQPLTARTAHEWGVVAEVCAKWQGAGSGARTRLALPEGSGSHAPQHPRALHPTIKGAHRTRSWLRTLARRRLSSGSRQINANRR
jgi:enoyl-CoA hydratase/carnithine racemase